MGRTIPQNAAGPGLDGDGNAVQLQGRDVATTAPTATQVLAWNGSAWAPADAGVAAAHSPSHENGGADKINVGSLNGELADPQPPKTHAPSHQNGSADEISVAALSGELADPQNAGKLQARTLASTAPTDGQLVRWNAGSSQWEPSDEKACKIINLSPEDPGAVLYPDGANNDVQITTGHDQTNNRNYYEITAAAAPNDYDIVVEIRVPTGWVWSEAKILVWTDDKDNNSIAVEIFDTNGASDGSDTVTPASNNTWEEKTLTTPAGTYASEGLFHIHIKGTIGLANKKVRIGAKKFKSS